MGEEIARENGQIFDCHGLVTLTVTSDRVILHTVMHHSSTSNYIPNFIKIEETFCGRTDRHLRPINVIKSTRKQMNEKTQGQPATPGGELVTFIILANILSKLENSVKGVFNPHQISDNL